MSARARGWARQHAGAGDAARVEGKAFQVLMAIATDAGEDGVATGLTTAMIGRRIHAARSTVFAALRSLRELGALQVDTVRGQGSTYRVLQPDLAGRTRPTQEGISAAQQGIPRREIGRVTSGCTRPIFGRVPIEEASLVSQSSSTTTVVPVPPGGAAPAAAGGGGRSLRDEASTRPRPVPTVSPLGASAGRGQPDPLELVLERLSAEAAAVLRAALADPDRHQVAAGLVGWALRAADELAGQESAAITRPAGAGRRAERPRPNATPAASSRRRPPAPRPAPRPGRDLHVRPASTGSSSPPAPRAGPIPRAELERIAAELAADHGVAELAGEAARVAWLKAQQGSCGNVLLYLDGVLRRRARQAAERAERAAAAAAAPPRCEHRNDPATCGQCNYVPPAGIPAQLQADLDAVKRQVRPWARPPPAAAS